MQISFFFFVWFLTKRFLSLPDFYLALFFSSIPLTKEKGQQYFWLALKEHVVNQLDISIFCIGQSNIQKGVSLQHLTSVNKWLETIKHRNIQVIFSMKLTTVDLDIDQTAHPISNQTLHLPLILGRREWNIILFEKTLFYILQHLNPTKVPCTGYASDFFPCFISLFSFF